MAFIRQHRSDWLNAMTSTLWDDFRSGACQLFVWEAFVSGSEKAYPPSHSGDAALAISAFLQVSSNMAPAPHTQTPQSRRWHWRPASAPGHEKTQAGRPSVVPNQRGRCLNARCRVSASRDGCSSVVGFSQRTGSLSLGVPPAPVSLIDFGVVGPKRAKRTASLK
jgi:hypothetical protein